MPLMSQTLPFDTALGTVALAWAILGLACYGVYRTGRWVKASLRRALKQHS